MILFITVLRALAACLITNAHYTGVYPTDLIANGGLVGDVIFFAVSGYCLYNVKSPFINWYCKRIYRIYIPLIIMTLVYIVSGSYSLNEHSLSWYFVYPTYYHFVGSIIVLYIPFYVFIKIDYVKKKLVIFMLIILIIQVVTYITVYDRSYYHIDTVREPMIRFLFFESMLLGAWFRQNDYKFRNKFKVEYLLVMIGILILYFASKIIFSRYQDLSRFQIINQILIYGLLFYIFALFSSLDSKMSGMPHIFLKVISFVASISLEIYLVQYVLIDIFRQSGMFPINWIIITFSIIIVAFVLHILCEIVYSMFGKINKYLFKKEK